MMKLTRHAPASDQPEMRQWIRDDFQANKSIPVEDEMAIKMHLTRGRLAMRELAAAVGQPR